MVKFTKTEKKSFKLGKHGTVCTHALRKPVEEHTSQPAIICSKLTIEILWQSVKYVQS